MKANPPHRLELLLAARERDPYRGVIPRIGRVINTIRQEAGNG